MPDEPQEIVPAAEPVESEPQQPVDAPVADQAVTPQDEMMAEEATPGEISPEELDEARANEVAFSWRASEYVHHRKGAIWYVGLGAGVLVLVLISVWLHYWLELGAFLAMGVAAAVYGSKPPRTLTYELTPDGITIEGRKYLYKEFRSFGVVPDVDWHTIDLEPVARLRPRLAVLFDVDDFDAIVGHLELHLPRADRDPDLIEQLSQYLRF